MKGSRSLQLNAFFNVIKQCSNIVIPLITYTYVSRVLGAELLGRVSFADSTITLLLCVAQLGIPTYAVREGSKLRYNKKEFEKFAAEVTFINLISTAICYVIVSIMVITVSKYRANSLIILIFSLRLIAELMGRDWINSANEDYMYISLRHIGFHLLGVVLTFVLVRNQIDYIKYVVIMLIASSGGYILNLTYTSKYARFRIRRSSEVLKRIVPILYLFGVSIATQIYIRSDVLMLGFFDTDKSVGIYTLASKAYTIVKSVLNALIMVVIPRLSVLFARDNSEEYKRILCKLRDCLFIMVFPCAVGLFFESENILWILGGQEFVAGSDALRILCIALVFAVFGCFYANAILIPQKNERGFFIATVVSAVVNIGTNLVFIPKFGMMGAALTTAIAEMLVMSICIMYSKGQKLNFPRGIVEAIAGCIMIAIVCNIINQVFMDNRLAQIVLSVICSSIVYVLALLIAKNSIIYEIISSIKNKVTCKS